MSEPISKLAGENQYAQTEWGTVKINKPIPDLGPRYEFLNDPDIRKRVSKIKKELLRTQRKISRKKSDRIYLLSFVLLSASLIALLTIKQEPVIIIIPLLSACVFTGISIFLYQLVLAPIKKDLKYLDLKVDFLSGHLKKSFNMLKKPDIEAPTDSPITEEDPFKLKKKRRHRSKEEFNF